MHQIQPTVGQWYIRPESGLKFEVIDIDDGDGMIEIQDEEGTLDLVDSDTWFTLPVEMTDQPLDSSGAFDILSEPDADDSVDHEANTKESLRTAQDELLDASAAEEDDADSNRRNEAPRH